MIAIINAYGGDNPWVCEQKRHSSREDVLEDELGKHWIREWIAVSAARLHDQGSHRRTSIWSAEREAARQRLAVPGPAFERILDATAMRPGAKLWEVRCETHHSSTLQTRRARALVSLIPLTVLCSAQGAINIPQHSRKLPRQYMGCHYLSKRWGVELSCP